MLSWREHRDELFLFFRVNGREHRVELTGHPPYMGMLLGLLVLRILTDEIHYGDDERKKLKAPQALSRIDTQGAFFFLGILLSVSRCCKLDIQGPDANFWEDLDSKIVESIRNTLD